VGRARSPGRGPPDPAWLLAAGAVHTPFGASGARAIAYLFANNSAHAVAIQSDGKIVVAGQTYQAGSQLSDFLVIRLNADGSRDSSFGTNGLVTTDFGGGEDEATAIAIQ